MPIIPMGAGLPFPGVFYSSDRIRRHFSARRTGSRSGKTGNCWSGDCNKESSVIIFFIWIVSFHLMVRILCDSVYTIALIGLPILFIWHDFCLFGNYISIRINSSCLHAILLRISCRESFWQFKMKVSKKSLWETSETEGYVSALTLAELVYVMRKEQNQ